jgi:hypothetical protein
MITSITFGLGVLIFLLFIFDIIDITAVISCLTIVIILGIFLALIIPIKYTEEIVTVENYIKSEEMGKVIVQFPNDSETVSFEDYITVSNISDTSSFIMSKSYNSFNCVLHTNYKIK